MKPFYCCYARHFHDVMSILHEFEWVPSLRLNKIHEPIQLAGLEDVVFFVPADRRASVPPDIERALTERGVLVISLEDRRRRKA